MRPVFVAASIALTSLPATAWAQSVGQTSAIGTLVGRYAAPQQGMYGTDLGHAVKYLGNLRVLFGDTWADTYGNLIPPSSGSVASDDAQGWISLTDFSTGPKVENWLNQSSQTPAWRRDGPTLNMLRSGSTVKTLTVYNGGSTGTVLPMGVNRTPTAAFADDWSGGGLYAFFSRQVGNFCSATVPCTNGYTCEPTVGTCNGDTSDSAIPCIINSLSPRCPLTACRAPTGYLGVCIDPTSSMYDTSEDGRILSAVLKNRFGNADRAALEKYYTKDFNTNKFNNLTARVVTRFGSSLANSTDDDWNPPTGGGGTVFLWGRPNYAAYGAVTGKSAKLYFAYARMPAYNTTGPTLPPNYFTGFSATLAGCTNPVAESKMFLCFSNDPKKARALNLSAPGTDNTKEVKDVVGQHAIAFVPQINKWVMIYGGDAPDAFLLAIMGPNFGLVQRNPAGAYYARFAVNPWGPWSAPTELMQAGSYNYPPTLQYANNGILYSPYCTAPSCAQKESFFDTPIWSLDANKVGRLYAPTIVQEWTTFVPSTPASDADIFWFTSTWDPYQVVIMKTRINP